SKSRGQRVVWLLVWSARLFSNLLNRLMPGKLRAAVLLVANERTRQALPPGFRGEVVMLVENGVDLGIWSPDDRPRRGDGPTRFTFLGRLVDWKAVDLLLEAFARVRATHPPRLELVGDGPMRGGLEARVQALGLGGRVHFAGWLPQGDCVRRLRESDV